MTFFLVIDLVLRIFPFFSHIFRMFTMLNVVYDTIFHSVHAFTHIRQYYFSKYWGDQCMGGPPISNFGETVPPVPPRSPPLTIASVLRVRNVAVIYMMWMRRVPVTIYYYYLESCET